MPPCPLQHYGCAESRGYFGHIAWVTEVVLYAGTYLQRFRTHLVIFDQIAHRIVDKVPKIIQIVSSYDTENAPLTVLVLVVIATVEASLHP